MSSITPPVQWITQLEVLTDLQGSIGAHKGRPSLDQALARGHCSSAAAQPSSSSTLCPSAMYNQPMYQPTHFPNRQTYDSAATEPTHTAACLNRGQSSSPRTLGASTKTSHAQGPRTKQSYSDVVNESVKLWPRRIDRPNPYSSRST